MANNTQSHHLVAEACKRIPGGVDTSLRNVAPHLVFRSAHGAILTDVDGSEYVDYHAAFGAIVLGHNFDAVNHRVMDRSKISTYSGRTQQNSRSD
jgi:glutamate-1-semialdehyde 2,1-aminomutase